MRIILKVAQLRENSLMMRMLLARLASTLRRVNVNELIAWHSDAECCEQLCISRTLLKMLREAGKAESTMIERIRKKSSTIIITRAPLQVTIDSSTSKTRNTNPTKKESTRSPPKITTSQKQVA